MHVTLLGLFLRPWEVLTDHVTAPPLVVTAMSLEASQKLSIPELLRVLDGKLREEYSRVQGMTLSSTIIASLEPEVRSIFLRGEATNPDSEPLDQESGNPGARYPEISTLSTKHVATGEQVASGDHLLHRSMYPRGS